MTRRVCATPGCPALTDQGQRRCGPCQARAEQRRGTARQRGYDTAHDKTGREAKAQAQADRAPCPRCGEPMLPGQALDWGHTTDRAAHPQARADRVEHATCNRSAGGRLAHSQ